MSLPKFRNFLYRFASFLGDVQAVKTGKIVQRLINKEKTKLVSRIVRGK